MDIWIDIFTNCLVERITNTSVETVIARIQEPWGLTQCKTNGWFVDWDTFPNDVEIFKIATWDKRDEPQGLFAVKDCEEWDSAQLVWGCSAPWNTAPNVPDSTCEQRFLGVGAHIFAGAYMYSLSFGHSGAISGFATNEDVLKHYMETFGAILARDHENINPYHFIIPSPQAVACLSNIDFRWED